MAQSSNPDPQPGSDRAPSNGTGLDGRIVVLGAYGLIGSAIVRRAAGEGRTVVAIGSDGARLDALRRDVEGAVETLVHRIAVDGKGSLDLAAPVAAAMLPLGGGLEPRDASDLGGGDLLDVARGKLAVQAEAARLVLPHLTPDGAVMLFSGMLSRSPVRGLAAMSAVNAALEAYARALAAEIAPRRALCVSPALVTRDGDPGSVSADAVARTALGALALPLTGAVLDVVPLEPVRRS